MLKLSTMFKVLVVSALVMGFGLVVIGSDTPVPIQPLPEGDGADYDLKEQLTPVHQDPFDPNNPPAEEIEAKRAMNETRGLVKPNTITNFNAGVGDKTVFFAEDFQSYTPSEPEDPYPPAANGWTRIVTIPTKTWFIATAQSGGEDNGTQASLCPYSLPGEVQDEWMITPLINAGAATGTLNVDFLYLHDNDSWPFELDLLISTTGVDPGDFTLLWEAMNESHPNMEYTLKTFDLSAYIPTPFYLAWRYQGEDANLGAIDDVVVYDTAPSVGRCCYGVDMLECADNLEDECIALSGDWTEGLNCTDDPCLPAAVGRCCYGVDMLECADNTEAECATLSGDWTEGLNCTDHPCPATPPNDDPENAIEVFPPETVTGSTTMATIDCPGVLDWNAVWYVVDAPYAENDIYINYCGTPGDIYTVGIVVYEEILPLDCNAYIIADSYAFNDCGDGTTNPDMSWDRLPGPTRYLIPILADDGPLKVGMDFSFDITLEESPELPPGASCADPFLLSLGSGDLPYTEAGLTTCGMGDLYNETCLGYYDGGEDFIMELTLTEDLVLNITLDPDVTYTGISIDDECPDTDESCISTSTMGYSGGAHTMLNVDLAAGTYWIMVDTWPSPDCIPSFDLIIEVAGEFGPGNDCSDPFVVKLPDDMVDGPDNDEFINVNTTCGRIDDYDQTCLGYYDGGEDMIYMLDVGGTGTYNFVLSSSSTYKGMSIDDECPDADETCLYEETASSGDVSILGVELTAGYYYIQIDTWPSPDCIPEFTLTISAFGGLEPGDAWDDCIEISGDVVDLAYTTNGYTPDGPGGCMTSPNIWYCYTATESGLGTVSLCGSSYDTKLAVYDGVDPYTATMLGCNDDACGVQSELTDLPFTNGNTYLVEVGGYSSNAGDGILNIEVIDCPPPPNDNCEDVTPELLLHGNVVTFTGDNTCATHQCDFFPDGHTWHAFTLPTQMAVTLDYCTNSPAWGNAWLNLAIGCPCTDFTVAGTYNFDDCGDGNVVIYWDILAPGTYYYPVLKDPANDAVGPYTLHVVGYAPSLLTTDPDAIDFGTQPAGSMGSTELTLGAVGEGDINFAISYVYNVKSASPGTYDNLSTTAPEKPEYSGPAYEPPTTPRQGGDLLSSATAIGAMPYNNTGTTSGYVNDYDEVCPYTGSTAPDVVYSYTPTANKQLDVDMWGSAYDTKIYVYENDEYTPVACNDDYWSDYTSALFNVDITAGNTYYIVVDGYGTSNGEYVIFADIHDPPDPFECPPGSIPENEPCGDDTNGGCNMASPAFEAVNCGDTICGTAWADGGSRDTDWYELTFYAQIDLTITASANFEFIVGPVDTSDCALAAAIDPYVIGAPNTVQSVTKTVGPGTYWIFMGFTDFYDYPCGTNNDYWITFTCPEGPVLWLSAAPETGTVPAGGTLPITVMYDATELDLGVYSADIKLTHDGRGETVVPVTLTIGTVVPPDTLALAPDPISSMMENDIDGVDPNGYIYIGDDLGWVNPAVTAVGDGGGATIPCTYETIGSYPGLTAPILKLTFDLSDFAAMYNEGLMWDCETRSYTVEGTDDGGPISAGDDFTYCGHTSGDLDLDGEIDISDLVMMIEYMFSGGDAPEILLTADIDGNGEVDISDLVAFVEYMFNNGVPPVHQ